MDHRLRSNYSSILVYVRQQNMAMAWASVCPSVCHTLKPYQNGAR